jgi:hypothetical protein
MGKKQNPDKMKQFLLPLGAVVLSSISFAQVANGDFERWMDVQLHTDPVSAVEVSSSNSELFYRTGEHNVFQVAGQSSNAMRIENFQSSDEVIAGYYIIGTVPNSEGESLVFGGGFDITDTEVNGLNMDLRYDFPDGSEGFVIVQFKSNGVPVGEGNMGDGTYVFYLDGTQDWENTTFSFVDGIDSSVDQCVIGIASADLIGDDVPFVAGAFVEVDNLSFVNSNDGIPASDFEDWDSVGDVPVPFFVDIEVNFENTFERTEDAFQGAYALHLMNREINGETRVGRALLGDREGDMITPNIELRQFDVGVSFAYRYEGTEDAGEAVITFYNEEEGSFSPIFSHSITLSPNETYEMVDYNFVEDLGPLFDEADYLSIEFTSSTAENDDMAESGNSLFLDRVEITSTLSDDFRNFLNPREIKIRAFPNPTTDVVRFNFGTNRSGFYRVFNSSGTQVGIKQFSSTKTVVHNLANHPPGKYFFKFFHNGGVDDVRVIKL